MKRGINILHGVNGYRDQLRRADRFLQKMLTSPEGWEDFDDLEYQDKVWAFFQNCWHIKDWLRNDKDLSTAVQDSVLKAVHHSPTLQICRGLCNGTKHYLLHNEAVEFRATSTFPSRLPRSAVCSKLTASLLMMATAMSALQRN